MTLSTGPVRVAGRATAPDVARGVMLAFIALAHAPAYLTGRTLARGGYPAVMTELDRAVVFVETTAVVGRAYPLFAALMGYGIVSLWTRQLASGATPAAARRLVRRRGCWLLVFGFAHAALLWSGDILGAYGVLALALGLGLVQASTRLVTVLLLGSLLVVTSGGAAMALADVGGTTSPLASTGETDPLAAVAVRLSEWAPSLVLQPLGMAGAVLAGCLAARRRLLEAAGEHRRLLRGTAATGLVVAVAGGIPWATVTAGYWQDPTETQVALAGALHSVTGYGGLGYAALVAVVTSRRGRPGRVTTALRACGRRSLTCYLLQSLLFVLLLAPYTAHLGAHIGPAAAALTAVGVWVLTVLVATLLERGGVRGPAESALRALVYRS